MAYDWYDNVPTRATTITARFSSRRTDGEPEVLTGDLPTPARSLNIASRTTIIAVRAVATTSR